MPPISTGSSAPVPVAIGSGAELLLSEQPDLRDRLSARDRAAIVEVAGGGAAADAVRLMIELGFSPNARNEFGETPLHAAAAAGDAETVRLLLEHGAELDARDANFDGTPLGYATVTSGEHPNTNGDWVASVQLLLNAGADRTGVWVADRPPSEDVAEVLRSYGIASNETRAASSDVGLHKPREAGSGCSALVGSPNNPEHLDCAAGEPRSQQCRCRRRSRKRPRIRQTQDGRFADESDSPAGPDQDSSCGLNPAVLGRLRFLGQSGSDSRCSTAQFLRAWRSRRWSSRVKPDAVSASQYRHLGSSGRTRDPPIINAQRGPADRAPVPSLSPSPSQASRCARSSGTNSAIAPTPIRTSSLVTCSRSSTVPGVVRGLTKTNTRVGGRTRRARA